MTDQWPEVKWSYQLPVTSEVIASATCGALTGLWLGLLGIAMATGLAVVLRSGEEIPEDYWRSIIDYPTPMSR